MNKKIENLINFIKKPAFIYFSLIILFYFASIYYFVTNNTGKKFNYKVGDIAKEDIVVTKDISYIDVEQTEKKKQELLASIQPVYLLYESKYEDDARFYDRVLSRIDKLIKIQSESKKEDEKKTDSSKSKVIDKEKIYNDEELLKFLGEGKIDKKLIDIFIKLSFNTEDFTRFKLALNKIYEVGITKHQRKELKANNNRMITVYWYRKNEVITKTISIDSIITSDDVSQRVYSILKAHLPYYTKTEISTLKDFVKDHLYENLFFDPVLTKRAQDEALAVFKPVKNVLKKGKIIVRHGQEILPEDIKKIEILNEYGSNINYTEIGANTIL